MPELPEIVCRAREMCEALAGRTIRTIEVAQPKCLNVPVASFTRGLAGARIVAVDSRGKWLFVETDRGHLLLNLGMGGEILLVGDGERPEKWRLRLDLDGDGALSINFWWFGYAHYVSPGRLASHEMTAKLGPNALDATREQFRALLAGRRGGIKAFLLDQSRLAGIGNAYIHDILFRARLHPLRTIPTLRDDEVGRLHEAIRTELQRSIDVGGAGYEVDLRGRPGGFTAADLLVGYREGEPCPACGTAIEKVRTGATASFICPRCQSLSGPDSGDTERADRRKSARIV